MNYVSINNRPFSNYELGSNYDKDQMRFVEMYIDFILNSVLIDNSKVILDPTGFAMKQNLII